MENGFKPELKVLSQADKEKIFQAALQVLEDVGMQLFHEEALALMKSAGCIVDQKQTVKISREQVQKAIASALKNIPVFNREGKHVMDLGGRRAYFGTGSDLMYAFDAGQGERHLTGLADIETAAKVCDALPNIDFIMSFAHPQELHPDMAYLESFRCMAANSVKPIVNTAKDRNDLEAMWEISKIIRGSETALRQKPYTIQYAEPISPLKHPHASMDKLIFCAEKGIPVIYSPAPIAGSTAPMTIAGHVVQGLAESLFGLVVHQLAAEGAPFLMGIGAAVLDMSTSQCCYNAPEYLMAYLATVEMSHHLNLPNWGYAGTSDAQIPDGQATFEAGLLAYMSLVAGSNLNHDVGYLNFGLTGSLEMVVIMDEVIDQIRRMQQGIPVNEETLAIQVIEEGARQGEFLSHPHTLKHLRNTQWRPQLMNRMGHEQWDLSGRKDLLTRAREQLKKILESHQARPIDEDKALQIQACMDLFHKNIL
ncbi:MAG: trimethylamine methyltransferase family protein [Desulfobacterales bacterium]|nr:trimethylamine methyltransferase family protein [Desulfobacterales bacterium]MDX2511086.1 trimethylamine methyltransferase family protein [Desulfobacterales bacterium]